MANGANRNADCANCDDDPQADAQCTWFDAQDRTFVHPAARWRHGSEEDRVQAIASHFDVVIGAVSAGRDKLVRLHCANRIDGETLRSLERDLDLEELGAIAAKV